MILLIILTKDAKDPNVKKIVDTARFGIVIIPSNHGISYNIPSVNHLVLAYLFPIYTKPKPLNNGIKEVKTHKELVIF